MSQSKQLVAVRSVAMPETLGGKIKHAAGELVEATAMSATFTKIMCDSGVEVALAAREVATTLRESAEAGRKRIIASQEADFQQDAERQQR